MRLCLSPSSTSTHAHLSLQRLRPAHCPAAPAARPGLSRPRAHPCARCWRSTAAPRRLAPVARRHATPGLLVFFVLRVANGACPSVSAPCVLTNRSPCVYPSPRPTCADPGRRRHLCQPRPVTSEQKQQSHTHYSTNHVRQHFEFARLRGAVHWASATTFGSTLAHARAFVLCTCTRARRSRRRCRAVNALTARVWDSPLFSPRGGAQRERGREGERERERERERRQEAPAAAACIL